MKKTESKYFYTASLMDEALLRLLEQKDFAYITVKELCKKAGVNRSTFYLHYETMEDLLAETIELLGKRFTEHFTDKLGLLDRIADAPKERLMFLTADYLLPYLSFVKENRRAFKTIHEKPQLFNAEKVFLSMSEKWFYPILDRFEVPKVEAKYVFAFFCKGSLAVIMEWVGRDCDDDPERIMEIIRKCANVAKIDEK